MSIRNIVGQIPEPQDLFGRDDVLAQIRRRLADNNILLLGPRRFGKSGIMRHLYRRPPEGYLPVWVDLMDATSPAEFGERLLEEIWKVDPLRKLLATLKALPARLR